MKQRKQLSFLKKTKKLSTLSIMMQRVSKFLPTTLRSTKNLRLASTKTPPSKSSAQPMSEGAMDVQIYGGLKDQVSLPLPLCIFLTTYPKISIPKASFNMKKRI